MIRILVPLDGSTRAEEALNHALSIARTFSAELVLLRVIAESDTDAAVRMDSVDFALWRHQAHAYLNGLIDKYADKEVSMRIEVAEGNAAESIARLMTGIKPDLLVLTRYGRGNAQDFIAGGTAQKIISSADCSVLLLDPRHRIDPDKNYRRILIPIDSCKESDCAVAVATMIAEISGASLLLLYVIDEPGLPSGVPDTRHARQLVNEMHRLVRYEAQRRLRELAAKLPKGIAAETRVLVSADVPIAIESTAEDQDSDLLVLHTTDAGRRYGSVNQSLIQYSHRPLFILRPPAGEGLASNFRSVYLDDQTLAVS